MDVIPSPSVDTIHEFGDLIDVLLHGVRRSARIALPQRRDDGFMSTHGSALAAALIAPALRVTPLPKTGVAAPSPAAAVLN